MIALVLVNVVPSLLLMLAVWLVCRSRLDMSVVCWISGLAVLGACALGLVFFGLQALLTCVAAIICRLARAKDRTLLYSAAAMLAIVYLLAGFNAAGYWNRHAELQAAYPLESVADRLAYEQRRAVASEHADTSADASLHPELERRLAQLEAPFGSMRHHMLYRLHESTRIEFVLAEGFGPARMIHVHESRLQLPEVEPIPLPPPPRETPPSESKSLETPPLAEAVGEPAQPSREDLLSLHTSGRDDFLDPRRLGYVKDRRHVAGFQSHAFSRTPQFFVETNRAEWQVTRLELVSLLKHETPVAYVSKHLPRMDELGDAPTRPLDAFEQEALPRLKRDKDLVVEEAINRIRMLGSLRAGKHCLDCHSVRRGELLGAFSYLLHRRRPLPTPPPNEPQARWQANEIDLACRPWATGR